MVVVLCMLVDPSFVADEFDGPFQSVDGIGAVGLALFVRPCQHLYASAHSIGCPTGKLALRVLEHPWLHFRFGGADSAGSHGRCLGHGSQLHRERADQGDWRRSLFDGCAHGDYGVCGSARQCEVGYAESVDLGVGCEVLVDAFQGHWVVVEVEAELVYHCGEFADFVAEYCGELLGGHWFDASVVLFEALHDEVEFCFGFFQVGHGFYACTGFIESVFELFSFGSTLVLADDDACVVWFFAGLFAVCDHCVREFFVGILQIVDDDDCLVG